MTDQTLFSTAEAADYVGISRQGLKYHVHVAGNLTPDAKVGHALVFTRETLDRFLARRRPPGRPPQTEDPD